jgi:hypothetical protein
LEKCGKLLSFVENPYKMIAQYIVGILCLLFMVLVAIGTASTRKESLIRFICVVIFGIALLKIFSTLYENREYQIFIPFFDSALFGESLASILDIVIGINAAYLTGLVISVLAVACINTLYNVVQKNYTEKQIVAYGPALRILGVCSLVGIFLL